MFCMRLQGVRQALRTLASRPGFTAAAVVSLALAIGAVTSVYALIRTVFDRPPAAVAEPDGIVAISAVRNGKRDARDNRADLLPQGRDRGGASLVTLTNIRTSASDSRRRRTLS